jgi:hypothetical protein
VNGFNCINLNGVNTGTASIGQGAGNCPGNGPLDTISLVINEP